ncbi:hypothetical protein GCM10022408_38040 [Hymenobacter fastidiosus]|uniref:Uncharacterized protein n=1 Tax=Hymenobacter fastidiosus TaxID=486264 RepID=A0ABP7T347_9BACT
MRFQELKQRLAQLVRLDIAVLFRIGFGYLEGDGTGLEMQPKHLQVWLIASTFSGRLRIGAGIFATTATGAVGRAGPFPQIVDDVGHILRRPTVQRVILFLLRGFGTV